MKLTQKIKIKPNEKQEEVLRSLSEMCRLLYNFSLAERIENWKENKDKPKSERSYISYIDQVYKLPKLKEEFPKYKWVYTRVLQMTLRKLDADYKSFFALKKNGDETARPPRFKGKKYFTSLRYNQSGFKIEKGKIKFSHNHPCENPLVFDIPEKFDFQNKKVKQVEIFRDELEEECYVSITYEVETPRHKANGLYQAFDLGITKHTGVNMHGKFIEFRNPRPDQYWQSKFNKVQSKRDHCKRESNRWKRYNEKLRKMKRKLANQLKDYQHQISKRIVENTRANTIIIGKLSSKEMASRKNHKARRLNRSLQNTGTIGRFARFLAYKAELVGKKAIEISEKDTTKECCVCNEKVYRPLYKRTIKCGCGNVMDRDKNSAVNILKRFLSQERLVDRQSLFMRGFLRQTGSEYAYQLTSEYSQETPCDS